MPTDDFFDRLPKVELHLHLEGAIPLDALWNLVGKYGGHADAPTPEALAAKFTYLSFPHSIDTWVWKNQFLREADDFTFIAELLVALSDKLWKGARVAELERRVIDAIAERRQVAFWDVYVEADTLFESIADGGERRLRRS